MKCKYFFIILILLAILPVFGAEKQIVFADTLPFYNEPKLTLWKGSIPHFFSHEIINNEDIAFSSNNVLSSHFDKDCITHIEFSKFLETMFKNNYMLVDIYDVVEVKNEKAYFKNLYFPEGKKPMLLSFDDMTYDTKGTGLSDKIILTKDNKIASFTSENNPQIEFDKDSLPILEQFLTLHPDFSFNGARAIICPTGYNGILGYRINHTNKNYKTEIENINPLITHLKKLNYHFGCHTYNHISVKYTSCSNLIKDLTKYDKEIESVIGKTDIFCFPCGARTSTPDKLQIMKNFGYRIFLCVGLVPDKQAKSDCVFLDRKVLDGHSLRNFRKIYKQYFDTFAIYDNKKRKIGI